MLKRILVALDPDQDTPVATRYARELATRHRARVSGLAVVDTQGIAREVGPGGAIGAMYYAEKVRQQITAESRETARELIQAFEQALERNQLDHSEQIREGVPAKRIVEDMKYHDLLVIGRSPHFSYRDPDKRTHTLDRIVKNGVAPTLVVTDTFSEIRRVLICYDGSDPAARTMQQFAQLMPFGADLDVELIHVRGSGSKEAERESELLLKLAAEYLQAHGFERITETSVHTDDPASRILAHAQAIGADLIAAGAHSVSAVKRIAFGSTTHHLLTHCDRPFFLYH